MKVEAASAVEADSDSSEGELEESNKSEDSLETEAAKKKRVGFRDRKVSH